MDEHQRRMWSDMLDQIRLYRDGSIDLRRLVPNLQGLLGAADVHDQRLIDEFWLHEAPIDCELELRTEPWAPPGLASDAALNEALDAFVRWVASVLSDADDIHT